MALCDQKRLSDCQLGVAVKHVHVIEVKEHLDFLAACRTGSAPAVGLEEGLMSVAMGVAAHRSIDEGRVVTLDEVLAEG